ncbi:MAG: amidase [Chloroflexota bacterium]|nr:amidase [Chloroflexota bacterium]
MPPLPSDPAGLTIAQASSAIRGGELSPVELAQAHLARIERLNPRLNAYVLVTAERALAEARAAEAEIASRGRRGPMHGVPFALKDLYDTAGIVTAGGTKVLAERVPERDATVTRRLREAGAVLLGKTNTHEAAYGVTTDNPHFGRTHNPWSAERIPGGSSGGSGAAVAARMAPMAMGTDTGGSIRDPATLNGVVGLKPTFGRVSKAGVLPLSWRNDHAGPLTHTVEDTAIVLEAIAGYDPDDAATVPVPVPSYTGQLGGDVRALRVGVARAFFFDHLHDGVRAALEEAINVVRGLGCAVRDVRVDGMEAGAGYLHHMVLADAQEIYAPFLPERLGDFGPDVAAHLATPPPDGVALARAMRGADEVSAELRRTLEGVDALITPTLPIPAPRFGEDVVAYGGVEEPTLFALSRCTIPFNLSGLPALSVPCGFTAEGLPVGMQIVARPFDEATALRLGHAYQQATQWHEATPPGVG